jgi:hypothetical protein
MYGFSYIFKGFTPCFLSIRTGLSRFLVVPHPGNAKTSKNPIRVILYCSNRVLSIRKNYNLIEEVTGSYEA